MSQPLGLIQLVSEEAMPSLFPILAMKPAALVHVTSHGFEHHSEPVLAAAAVAGLRPGDEAVRHFQLPPMPSITDTHNAVKEGIEWLQDRGLQPVINFTGGTKLMSIGTFYAAVSAQVPSLYVDGDNQTFVDGRTGPELASFLEDGLHLRQVAPHLSVSVIVGAHGGRFRSSGRDFAALVPLARHLFANPADETRVWEALFGKAGAFSKLQRATEKRDWLRAPEVQFSLPKHVRELAEAAGLVVIRQGVARLKCDEWEATAAAAASGVRLKFNEIQRLIAPIQERLNFFGGGWWEVAVAQAVKECGAFADIKLGAEISKAGRRAMEEDILAVQGVQLAYFSCKRGSQGRLQRQLEEVDASARRLGGKLALKYFAVCHLSSGMRAELEQRARQIRIRLIGPDDLVDGETLLEAVNS